MRLVPNRVEIEERIAEAFESTTAMYPELARLVQELSLHGGVVIFGGFVRDQIHNLIHGEERRSRDIDLVLRGTIQNGREGGLRNNFGGHRLTLNADLKVDFWELEKTYAFEQNLFDAELENLPLTTVYTLNACVFDLMTKSLIEHNSSAAIADRNVAFNCKAYLDRFPQYQAFRAMDFADRLGYTLDLEVAQFVREQIRSSSLSGFTEAVRKHRSEVKEDEIARMWDRHARSQSVAGSTVSPVIAEMKSANHRARPNPLNGVSRAMLQKTRRITEITRREIVDGLLVDREAFYGRLGLIPFLQRVWPLKQMPSRDPRFKDAEGDIWQHMVNNDDWTPPELLYERLGITEIPDEQFGRFLETVVHPLTCSDRDRNEKRIEAFNAELKNDRFEMRKTSELSGRPIYKLTSVDDAAVGASYEVVLSFAGEDRGYVQDVAAILSRNAVSLFYDDYEEVSLWGKNLTEHLHNVYSSSARFCVMFISKHYAEKVWPTHERRSAFEKAMVSKEEYILPARFDDTEIPGLHKHTGYVDLRKKTPRDLARLIIQKLGREFDDDQEITDDDIPF